MKDKINKLYDKDNKIAYSALLEFEKETTESNELYNYFDELLNMLNNERTYVRVRAFRLICALAKWDNEEKIEKNIDIILKVFDDTTSTSVRQYLDKINLEQITICETTNVAEKYYIFYSHRTESLLAFHLMVFHVLDIYQYH